MRKILHQKHRLSASVGSRSSNSPFSVSTYLLATGEEKNNWFRSFTHLNPKVRLSSIGFNWTSHVISNR